MNTAAHSQARKVGAVKVLSGVEAREFAELALPKAKARFRDRPDPDALSSERCGRASDVEKKVAAGNDPDYSTNAGAWKNRALDPGLSA
jgi:hypothetical protein